MQVADDLGINDLTSTGTGVANGLVPTPNIDALAAGGVRFTGFHTTALCSPTRAALLTGRNHHSVGMRGLANWNTGFPNCTGGIAKSAATLAEMIRPQGYSTFAVGKWHLGENVESQPQNVGFDDFYGFLSVSDMYTEWRDPHFFPEIVYSDARTEWVKNMPFNRCFVHATKGPVQMGGLHESGAVGTTLGGGFGAAQQFFKFIIPKGARN